MIRNITLSADETLIELARVRAREEQTSLNAAFRQWLESYAGEQNPPRGYQRLMERLHDVQAGGSCTREEMNER
jgi:hypothetical protein